MSIFLDTPNPFHLATPSAGWLQMIADYDGDLRLMPSQTAPVYRLMRLARHTGSTNSRLWRDKGLTMCADTKTAFDLHLVPITTFTKETSAMPVEHILQWLRDHDISAHGGADAVADRLDAAEAKKEIAADQAYSDEGRVRHRAARIGYQYRTGARVSLVRRIRREGLDVSPFTPPSTSSPVLGPAHVAPAEPSVTV